jgi:hypothetical protein
MAHLLLTPFVELLPTYLQFFAELTDTRPTQIESPSYARRGFAHGQSLGNLAVFRGERPKPIRHVDP